MIISKKMSATPYLDLLISNTNISSAFPQADNGSARRFAHLGSCPSMGR